MLYIPAHNDWLEKGIWDHITTVLYVFAIISCYRNSKLELRLKREGLLLLFGTGRLAFRPFKMHRKVQRSTAGTSRSWDDVSPTPLCPAVLYCTSSRLILGLFVLPKSHSCKYCSLICCERKYCLFAEIVWLVKTSEQAVVHWSTPRGSFSQTKRVLRQQWWLS